MKQCRGFPNNLSGAIISTRWSSSIYTEIPTKRKNRGGDNQSMDFAAIIIVHIAGLGVAREFHWLSKSIFALNNGSDVVQSVVDCCGNITAFLASSICHNRSPYNIARYISIESS